MEWTEKDIEILKKFYPLMGNSKPHYHPSLEDLLSKPYSIGDIRKLKTELGLRIDKQIGTENNEKRCGQCLIIKPLTEFGKPSKRTKISISKGVSSTCNDCRNRIVRDRRKNDFDYNYKGRLKLHLRREGHKYDTEYVEKLWNRIKGKLGIPPNCVFNDDIIFSVQCSFCCQVCFQKYFHQPFRMNALFQLRSSVVFNLQLASTDIIG